MAIAEALLQELEQETHATMRETWRLVAGDRD